MAEQQHIDMKQAVEIAFNALEELYPNTTLEDVLLEEVFLMGGPENEWEVTLGFALPFTTQRPGSISGVLPQAKPRAYKRFKINGDTGDLLGMLNGTIDAD